MMNCFTSSLSTSLSLLGSQGTGLLSSESSYSLSSLLYSSLSGLEVAT